MNFIKTFEDFKKRYYEEIMPKLDVIKYEPENAEMFKAKCTLAGALDDVAYFIGVGEEVLFALLDNDNDLAMACVNLKNSLAKTEKDFETLITNNLETAEAHDKAVLAMMFHNLVNFDPKNETHVKGLSAILSSDRVVKPNTVNYYDYLKSPQWQTVRDAALKRANYQCKKCGSAKNLEVHHITYKRLGYELPEDLVVLCKDCHENVHSKDLKQNDDFFANSSEGFPEGF